MNLPSTSSRSAIHPDDRTLRDLTSHQWKSGIAAWLGWMFDGMDQHLFTLVYAQFVVQLLGASTTADPRVGRYGSIIQAGFLVGWALGGGFFGRLGDRLGRSRTLALTVLTYAAFTGLSFFSQTWWHLLIFRFLSALGIGGEWAVGASLLSETWPRRWRPWMAAILQTGVNTGALLAVLASVLMAGIIVTQPRYIFLVGVLPGLLVFWIRKSVPESEEWRTAKVQARGDEPRVRDLFRGEVKRTTILVIVICACALSAHWAFQFWHQLQIKNLPDVIHQPQAYKNKLGVRLFFLMSLSSIVGNFLGAILARFIGFKKAITVMCLGYCGALWVVYGVSRPGEELYWWIAFPGFFQGVFALFTMYLPPLFPTLLRTTGAGFCYNIGRIFSACGVVFFGLFQKVGDYTHTILFSSLLFIPAAFAALFLPEAKTEPRSVVHGIPAIVGPPVD